MREIQVIRYVSNDGKFFDTREECIEYENTLKEYSNLKRALERVQKKCEELNCNSCFFRGKYSCIFGETAPVDWEFSDLKF